jgi:membrane associated rhomboid family serine protease
MKTILFFSQSLSDFPYAGLAIKAVVMNDYRQKEPFFNFTEPMPAYVAGALIALFILFAYVPGVYRLVGNLILIRPLGFQGASLAEQLFSLIGHGAMHGGWGHLLMNSGMIAVLGVATVKGARLKSVSQGRRRNPSLVFFTIFLFGIFAGGLAQWLWWFVINAPLGVNAPGALGASGGASALLAAGGWAMGGRYKMVQFAFGWALINAIIVVVGPFIGLNVAWAAHLGGYIGGMLLAPLMIKANSTSFSL